MEKSAERKRTRRPAASRRLEPKEDALSHETERAIQQAAAAARKLAEEYGLSSTVRSA